MFLTILMSFILTHWGCTSKPANLSEEKTDVEVKQPLDILVLKNQYALNVKLLNNALSNISEEEAGLRISDQVNSIKWIAGHTLDIQYNLMALLELNSDNPYVNQFGFGQPFDPEGDYPTLEKMITDWNTTSSDISKALDNLSQEQLDAPSPFPIPYNEQTIRGLMVFQMHYIGYKIGQIGLYRKYLGKAAMSYQ